MIENVKKLNKLLDPRARRKVALIVVLMIATSFVQTAGIASVMPFLSVLASPDVVDSNQFLNSLFQLLNFQSRESFLYFLGVVSFVLYVSGMALQALSFWVTSRFSQMQQFELSRRLMADYLRRPYTFFLTRNSSDLAKSVLQESGKAIVGALMPAMRFVSQVLLAVAILVLLISVQPMLALGVAAALSFVYAAVYISARKWLQHIGRDRISANRARFTAAAEAFDGAKEIRLLGRERDYLERFRQPSHRFARHQANAAIVQNLPQYVIEGIAFGGILLLALYLMSQPGGLTTALPLIGLYGLAGKQLIPAFQKIFATVSTLRFNLPSVDVVLDDLGDRANSLPLPPKVLAAEPLAPQRTITLDKVRYSYPESDSPALELQKLEIHARTTVGIVGSSGAGKSTLIDILLGLLTPDAGAVKVDGAPLTFANVRNWQAGLGYVPQHIFLADQTIAENIALGLPSKKIDRAAVEKAARLANLHDFVVNELPEGYDTAIGEKGVRLSGGQRQRIGIARALYRDPEVLVFDEATSALDNTTEHVVMEAIHNLSSQKTIVLVAHRLSTVEKCDQIYVLSDGKLVEQGTWAALMNEGQSHLQRLASGA